MLRQANICHTAIHMCRACCRLNRLRQVQTESRAMKPMTSDVAVTLQCLHRAPSLAFCTEHRTFSNTWFQLPFACLRAVLDRFWRSDSYLGHQNALELVVVRNDHSIHRLSLPRVAALGHRIELCCYRIIIINDDTRRPQLLLGANLMPLENCTLQEKPDIARQTSASGNGVSSFLKLWELDLRISGCAEN